MSGILDNQLTTALKKKKGLFTINNFNKFVSHKNKKLNCKLLSKKAIGN